MSHNASIVAHTSETSQEVSVTIKKPSTRYLDEFIKLRCAPDLLALDLFPNTKEITESMAAFEALRKHGRAFRFEDPNVQLLDVGCGHAPRTAALFAMRTKWQCIAVDPLLDVKKFYNGRTDLQRVHTRRNKIEDLGPLNWPCMISQMVIVAVHCHVPLDLILRAAGGPMRILLVAMECCAPLSLTGHTPAVEYEDWGIWSPKRNVKVYDLVQA